MAHNNFQVGVASTEDLKGRISQLSKLFSDKVSAFEAMRISNLDLVRRLAESVAVQMTLHGTITKLKGEIHLKNLRIIDLEREIRGLHAARNILENKKLSEESVADPWHQLDAHDKVQ